MLDRYHFKGSWIPQVIEGRANEIADCLSNEAAGFGIQDEISIPEREELKYSFHVHVLIFYSIVISLKKTAALQKNIDIAESEEKALISIEISMIVSTTH